MNGQVKTLTGIVSKAYGVQVSFRVRTGAVYMADTSYASLARKYGSAMTFAEILPGDKIQVTGKVWEDNSISAAAVKNLSLYPHNTTFSARVTTLDPYNFSFHMESRAHGLQKVQTTSLTSFTMNGSPSGLVNLEPGINVKVKGTWERNKSEVSASAVEAKVRLINIEFTGPVKGTLGLALTVIGNGNVIYGVDASGARIVSKNNKPISVQEIRLEDMVRVADKHRAEDTKVIAKKIKDLSIKK